jgi:hypothetical protein
MATQAILSQQAMLGVSGYGLRAFFILLFLVATIVNTVAYWSVAPFVVFTIMLAATLGLVRLLGSNVSDERRAVLILFIICWFWAGVSASYRDITGHENPDSEYFHELVTDWDVNPIEEAVDARPDEENLSVWSVAYQWFSVSLLQNAGVILIWRAVYRFFLFLGLGDGPYVGVTTNIAFVALSVAMGMRMLKATFGEDAERIRRYTLLCATCGMFWLFGSLHVRDSMALFCVTFLAMFWVCYLQAPGLKTVVALSIATSIGFALFGLVRNEFMFVPFAMILAGTAAKILGTRDSGRRRVWLYGAVSAVFVCGLAAALIAYPSIIDSIAKLLEGREKIYAAVSATESAGSLGNQLIVSQTGISKLVFSTAYLLINPIPVWVGFFSDLAYHLYKSFNALFMYGVLPLVAVGLWRIARDRDLRKAPLLFIAFSFAGFAMAIAYTSMESRHLGSFLILFILLGTVPDLKSDADRRMYKFGFTLLMAFLIPMHLTWLVYKAFV